MSTTTEPRSSPARRALRFAGAAGMVLAAWFGGMAAVARWIEPTVEAIVLVEPARVADLASRAPVTVLDAPPGALRVRGDGPGYVAALYALGARLVLPAAGGGCRGGAAQRSSSSRTSVTFSSPSRISE
ncbi:MAG: hypothetical protein WCK28_08135 [Burkholderiales bacterium]|jgi:hypothetical protein